MKKKHKGAVMQLFNIEKNPSGGVVKDSKEEELRQRKGEFIEGNDEG